MGAPFDARPDLFPSHWLAISRSTFLDILKTRYDNISPSPSLSDGVLEPSTSCSHAPSNDLFRDPKLVGEVHPPQAKSFTVEDELREYLKRPRYLPPIGSDLSPLPWWKKHEKDFPRIARCARDILAIPGESD